MSRTSTTFPRFFSRLRIALRLARRDLAAHKVRTLVAVLLFALPVSLMVGYVSAITGFDQANRSSPVSTAGTLSLDRDRSAPVTDETVRAQEQDISSALGELSGYLSAGALQTSTVTHGDRSTSTDVITVAPSPNGEGPAVEPGTVYLGDQAAFLMDVDTGDTVSVDGAELTVVRSNDYNRSVVSTSDVPVNDRTMDLAWYFPADPDLAGDIVSAVRNSGDLSTASVFNPNNTGPVSYDSWTILTFISIAALGILLVSAVITPVFAVAARRQRRAMGLMSASGSSPGDLRAVMFSEGFIVSILGSLLGLVLSVGVTAALVSLIDRAEFHWEWIAAVIVVVVAVVCGITSALVPAVRAGREDPVQALADGGSVRMTGFRLRMLTGLVFLIPGIPLAVSEDTQLQVLGVALSGIGVVLSSSLIVWLGSRLGSRLPTAGRLAVRDSLRNNHRTIPAVAAIAGAVFLSTTVITLPYNSDVDTTYRDNVAIFSTWTGGDESFFTRQIDGATERMDATDRFTIAESVGSTDDDTVYSLDFATRPGLGTFGYMTGGPTLQVTDGGLFAAFTGVSDDDVTAASDALAEGKAVVSDPGYLDDGNLLLDLRKYDPYYGTTVEGTDDEPGPPDETLSVPAVVIPGMKGTGALDGAAVSPRTAADLGLDVEYRGTALLLDSPVTPVQAALVTTGLWPVNSSYVNITTPALNGEKVMMTAIPVALSWILTLGTVLLVVLLAATESRRDMATITAVGAAPGLLRRFSAAQAVFLALGGTVVGVVVGLLPAVGRTVRDLSSYPVFNGFITPSQWLGLGLTAVVGPVLAWITGSIIGAVTSRDRSPVRRR